MKKLLIILAPALIFTNLSFAQPDTLWTRTYGGFSTDRAHCIVPTIDNCYLVAGYTHSFGAGGSDIWLLKIDEYGDTLWTKTYGWGRLTSETAFFIQKTSDEGYIITGYRGFNIWIFKIDTRGDSIFSATISSPGHDSGECVQQTSDGGFIVAGIDKSLEPWTKDIYIWKTNETGETEWSRTFGDTLADETYYILEDIEGGYIFVGNMFNIEDDKNIVCMIKLDENGDTVWSKEYDIGLSSNYIRCFQRTQDSGYILGGYTWSFGAYVCDYWLVKTDSIGNLLWHREYGNGPYFQEEGFCVQEVSDGGYILAGRGRYSNYDWDMYIVRTDSMGELLWDKFIGGEEDDWVNYIIETVDGGFIAVGFTESYGAGGRDFWVVKIESEGSALVEGNNHPIPSAFTLHPPHPNPFNPETLLSFTLPESEKASLIVYNLLGNEVVRLIDEYTSAGTHDVLFDAGDLPAGIYFVRLTAGDYVGVRKLVLIK